MFVSYYCSRSYKLEICHKCDHLKRGEKNAARGALEYRKTGSLAWVRND